MWKKKKKKVLLSGFIKLFLPMIVLLRQNAGSITVVPSKWGSTGHGTIMPPMSRFSHARMGTLVHGKGAQRNQRRPSQRRNARHYTSWQWRQDPNQSNRFCGRQLYRERYFRELRLWHRTPPRIIISWYSWYSPLSPRSTRPWEQELPSQL